MCYFNVFCKNYKAGGKNEMKKKGNLSKRILSTIEKIARNEISENLNGWPPHCMGIYHQPKRPKKNC